MIPASAPDIIQNGSRVMNQAPMTPTRERHENVESKCREVCWRAVDGSEVVAEPRPAFAREDGTSHQEAPEADDNQHQARDGKRHVVTTNMVGGAVSVELANARAEVDQNTQSKETGNGVNHTRSTKVMVAEVGDEPAVGVPAPSGGNNPRNSAQNTPPE